MLQPTGMPISINIFIPYQMGVWRIARGDGKVFWTHIEDQCNHLKMIEITSGGIYLDAFKDAKTDARAMHE